MLRIPLRDVPSQILTVALSGEVFTLRVDLNSRLRYRSLSIAQNGTDIVNGIAILEGVDLVDQFPILIQNLFAVNVNENELYLNIFELTDVEIEGILSASTI